MEDKKLIQLLRSFSAWEMRGLRGYLSTPALNSQEIVLQLFDLLQGYMKEGEVPPMQVVQQELFPGSQANLQQLRYVMTDLTKLAEKFLLHRVLEEETALKERLLLDIYLERGLEKQFSHTLNRSLKGLKKNARRDNNFHYQEFRLHEIGLTFEQQFHNRAGDDWIFRTLESLQGFALSTRLKYVCELVNRHNVMSGELDRRIVDNLLNEIDSAGLAELPSIRVYRCILMSLLESQNEAHYHRLREMLPEHQTQFSKEELGQMYSFALNYCIKKLNSGQTNYLRELFGLYQELIAGRILHDGAFLPPQHFKNIVTVGIRLEEYRWTENFIRVHHSDIRPEERENARIYNEAALAFARKDHSQAMRLLQKVEFTDVFYQLDSKAILLKSYYELGEFEPLLSLIDSFRLFLRRNRSISEYQRIVYLNLVKFVLKLVRSRLGSRLSVSKIREEVEATEGIADLRWLQGKLDEQSA